MSKALVMEMFKNISMELIDELKEEIGKISDEDKKKIMDLVRREIKKRFGIDIPKLKEDEDEEKSLLGTIASSGIFKGLTEELIDIPDEDKDDIKNIIKKEILKRVL